MNREEEEKGKCAEEESAEGTKMYASPLCPVSLQAPFTGAKPHLTEGMGPREAWPPMLMLPINIGGTCRSVSLAPQSVSTDR